MVEAVSYAMVFESDVALDAADVLSTFCHGGSSVGLVASFFVNRRDGRSASAFWIPMSAAHTAHPSLLRYAFIGRLGTGGTNRRGRLNRENGETARLMNAKVPRITQTFTEVVDRESRPS